jgi:hypothetical protein
MTTQLASIAQMGKGCTLKSVQVRINKFIKTCASKQGDQREWVFHIFELSDANNPGFRCEGKFWNRNKNDIPVNQVVEIEDMGTKGSALKVNEDRNGNPTLDVFEKCEFAFLQGGGQPSRQQEDRQQTQQQRQEPPQQRQTYQQGQQRPPQQNAQQARPTTNLGVTVGMALNNACNIVKEFDYPPEYYASPQFSSDVWTIASDILRVSRMLESDKLADSAKIRHGSHQPAQQRQPVYQEPQHDLPPEPEVTRPTNRQPVQPDGYVDPGIDGDDIPF